MLTLLLFIFVIFLILSNVFLYAKAYFFKTDGDVVIIHKPDGKTLFSLELNESPVDFHKKSLLIFRVVDEKEENS